MFNDYLAIAGSTKDASLTGDLVNNNYPYLALASVSTGGKYYWIKVLTQNQGICFVDA